MAWWWIEQAWPPVAALAVGLVLGRLWPRLRPPPPRPNPWAQRRVRDWETDKQGQPTDGRWGRVRWLDHGEDDGCT